MLVAITGTPGVGKSTVSEILRGKYRVIDIHSYAEEHGLFEEYDEKAGSYNVDVEKLNEAISGERIEGTTFMDGHLSHFVDCDMIIVLRCSPDVLAERLEARGYCADKIRENVQAEILDVILSESADSGIDTFEIDCTDSDASVTAEEIIAITKEKNGRRPGSVNWSEHMEKWF